MHERIARHEQLLEPAPSVLRREYENEIREGELSYREIELVFVDPDMIINLAEKPEHFPLLFVLQVKDAPDGGILEFYEMIFTNNVSLSEIERFLRENSFKVEMDDYGTLPSGCHDHFRIPLLSTLVEETVGPRWWFDTSRRFGFGEVGRLRKTYDSKGEIRVIDPEVLEPELSRLESRCTFSVVIGKESFAEIPREREDRLSEVVAFEYRRGGERFTAEHFVFRIQEI